MREPHPPLLDRSRLADAYDDDDPDRASLLELFLETSQAMVLALARALQGGDAAEGARLAHRLKGSSAVVGADRLAAVAGRLEALLAAGSLAEATAVYAELAPTLVLTAGAIHDPERARDAMTTPR